MKQFYFQVDLIWDMSSSPVNDIEWIEEQFCNVDAAASYTARIESS